MYVAWERDGRSQYHIGPDSLQSTVGEGEARKEGREKEKRFKQRNV